MEIISSKSNSIIKQIFESKAWTDFVKKHKSRIRETVFENISKVLRCKTDKLGFTLYKCEDCE